MTKIYRRPGQQQGEPTPQEIARAMQIIAADTRKLSADTARVVAESKKMDARVFGSAAEKRKREVARMKRNLEKVRPPVTYLVRAKWDR